MYLSWDEKIITDFSDENIESLYQAGYLFTRKGKGVMNQTRSLRIDMSKFELSSENRRILKKIDGVELIVAALPHENYTWQIGKMGKDFYETYFGPGIMGANMIKGIITKEEGLNFNRLLKYRDMNNWLGYCIAYESKNILHYSYPFYDTTLPRDMGLGMMLKAITWAKENNKKYVYLGSASRSSDTYKLQFSGLEYFDKDAGWSGDLTHLKTLLKS